MSNRQSSSRARNLALAAFAGQSGCASLVVVFTALMAGLWLDHRISGKPGLFTVILLLASVPLSIFIMLRIALRMIGSISSPAMQPGKQRADTPNEQKEDHL